jgi:DeoR/GlpR family transcriptional regulator of sugar metabolism
VSQLLKEERQQRILEVLQDNHKVTVQELSNRFGASPVTIRRDLQQLAQDGLLRRAHGGAIRVAARQLEPPVILRMRQSSRCKQAIGQAAAGLVADHESIFLGSGTTTLCVARNLLDRQDLTVITNALNVAVELASARQVNVVVTGGLLRASELSLVGHIAELSLREVRVDKVILGIPAIHLQAGLTNDYLPEVMTDRAIIEMAPELIVVADHTKFGRVASAYLAPVARITTLVTDAEVDSQMLAGFAALGMRVIVA